jgi:hypothetical protein
MLAPKLSTILLQIHCVNLLAKGQRVAFNSLQTGGGMGAVGAFTELQRQYMPGVKLGLNEPGVCDNSADTGYYGEQLIIEVYQILKNNGAALDWLGAEGYSENGRRYWCANCLH